MGRLQNTVLAFPTVEFPTRFSRPYLLLLLESGILGKIEKKNGDIRLVDRKKQDGSENVYNYDNAYNLVKIIREDNVDIYTDNNAYTLMKFLGNLFEERYKGLQEAIEKAFNY